MVVNDCLERMSAACSCSIYSQVPTALPCLCLLQASPPDVWRQLELGHTC